MSHAEDTLRRWMEMESAEHEYRRWAAFFYPLIDKPEQAQHLCEVGMSVARREIHPGAAARTKVEQVLRMSPNP